MFLCFVLPHVFKCDTDSKPRTWNLKIRVVYSHASCSYAHIEDKLQWTCIRGNSTERNFNRSYFWDQVNDTYLVEITLACPHETCRPQHLLHSLRSLASVIQDRGGVRFCAWRASLGRFCLPKAHPANCSAGPSFPQTCPPISLKIFLEDV